MTEMRCPECGSSRVERYVSRMIDCLDCGCMGSPEEFGAECVCEMGHHLPVWRCPVHGDVSVDAG